MFLHVNEVNNSFLIDVIFLFPHRHIGKKHILGTFVCIGNTAKNINFSLFIDDIISFFKRTYPDNMIRIFPGRCGNMKNNQTYNCAKYKITKFEIPYILY